MKCNSIRKHGVYINSLYTVDCFPNYHDIHDEESQSIKSAKDARLMTETHLLESSMADVLTAIEAAPDLSQSRKTHWSCSVRQICVAIGRPPESIGGRWSAVNAPIQRLHHAHIGCNPKTLSNHKANVKACLAWFAGAKNLPKRGTVLMPAWASLRAHIPDQFRRKRLSGLIGFASAKSVEPINVNEEVLDDYMAYRSGTTALACDDGARRRIVRAWNACVAEIAGWPQQRLVEPPMKSLTILPWENFPEQLRQEIEKYLEGFKKIRRGARGGAERQAGVTGRQDLGRGDQRQGRPPRPQGRACELRRSIESS